MESFLLKSVRTHCIKNVILMVVLYPMRTIPGIRLNVASRKGQEKLRGKRLDSALRHQ